MRKLDLHVHHIARYFYSLPHQLVICNYKFSFSVTIFLSAIKSTSLAEFVIWDIATAESKNTPAVNVQ